MLVYSAGGGAAVVLLPLLLLAGAALCCLLLFARRIHCLCSSHTINKSSPIYLPGMKYIPGTWYKRVHIYTHPKHNKHIYVQLGTLVRSYILSPRRAQSPDRLSNNQPFTLACAINRFTIINGFVVQATPLAHILFLLFTRVALGAYRRRPWCLVVLVTPTQHIEA